MRSFIIPFIVLCVTAMGNAATYYVDYSSGSDSKSGISKDQAWQRCPGMAGFSATYSHTAGDVFIFKGGVTWPKSTLPFTLAYSGAQGKTDTYTADTTWFAGTSWSKPTMDGQLMGRNMFTANNKGFFKINNLRFINAGLLTANAITGIDLIDCDNMEISYNTFAPESWGCLFIWTSLSKTFHNYLIHHNDISHCAFGMRVVPSGPSSIINNVQIYNNQLHDFHSQLSGQVHGDGIQHYVSPDVDASYDRYINGFKIFNNTFSGDFTQVAGSGGAMTALIYLSGTSKGVEIYNNVFTPYTAGNQSPNFFESFISLRDNPNRGGGHKIYNNTFVTKVHNGQSACILEDDLTLPCPNLSVKNNIFCGFDWPFDLRSTSDTFDYNDVHFVNCVGKWAGNWVETFSAWQKLGNDIHGISTDPLFASSTDFCLSAKSPCKDHGVILPDSFATDINGAPRPQGSSFDMGAFELSAQTGILSQPIQYSPQRSLRPNALSSGPIKMFDISGKLLRTGTNGSSIRSRSPVIVLDGKNAYIASEVKR